MIFEPEEGSVLDPYLFSGRPKKPNPREQYRPMHYAKPKPVDLSKSLAGPIGIFKTFAKVTSPEYQLKKTERQIKHYEAKENLIGAREKFAERKREYEEKHPSFLKKLMERREKSIYSRKRELSLPKAGRGE
jgi:hypothetical protein